MGCVAPHCRHAWATRRSQCVNGSVGAYFPSFQRSHQRGGRTDQNVCSRKMGLDECRSEECSGYQKLTGHSRPSRLNWNRVHRRLCEPLAGRRRARNQIVLFISRYYTREFPAAISDETRARLPWPSKQADWRDVIARRPAPNSPAADILTCGVSRPEPICGHRGQKSMGVACVRAASHSAMS
jgi:hypothetical protein